MAEMNSLSVAQNGGGRIMTISELKRLLGPSYGRAASAARCHDCRRPVVVGLDADKCAFTARVDPAPLTPRGEAQAILAGLLTYTATRTKTGGVVLTRRKPGHIHQRPAGRSGVAGRYDVWAEHRCAPPILDHADTSILDPDHRQETDEPPY